MALLGDAYVGAGRVAEGMTLLDETMAAVSGGEVKGVGAIGEIFCRLLRACERAADVPRAEQWLALARRSLVWTDFVPPTCRQHYGGILIATGRWAEAEDELRAAIRAFEGGYRAERVSPLVRLADLRVRQGRFEEAERLLEDGEWHPAARRVSAVIALGRHQLELAEEQADERAGAWAELTAARVLAHARDGRAPSHLQRAIERFSALGLPLEAARARLELAGALAPNAGAVALAEARLALRTVERLGAAHDADRAAHTLRGLGAPGRAAPKHYGELTKRETEVLSLLAAGCSNAEIGERLYISRRTAEHHVASILSKLGLRSRTEAAAYALREPERHVAE
jgi:DNA-binding CsgD family transcriptional regulator